MANNFLVDEKFRELVLHNAERKEIAAKTILLHEGQTAKKLFFVEKGCLRVWFNNNGKDITVQFFFEKETVSSIESFRKNIPSLLNIETVEATNLWIIDKKIFENLFDNMLQDISQRNKIVDAIFERTFDYMKHFFSFVRDTPEQRYLSLIKERPQIIQRVPQHYIASFLGITPVHLSRIKNKLARIKKH